MQVQEKSQPISSVSTIHVRQVAMTVKQKYRPKNEMYLLMLGIGIHRRGALEVKTDQEIFQYRVLRHECKKC